MVMLFMIALPGMAQTTIDVSATISSTSQLSVDISKIDAVTDLWTIDQSSIAFGTLSFDTANNIFTADSYYAVDIGVNDNSGSWTLTQTASSVTDGNGNDLDNNINVTFVEQLTSTTDNVLDKLSYAASDGQSYTSSDIAAGSWIRIYYGIETGSSGISGVVPIGIDKPAGTYTGQITLTLS